ncbi:hypothetical protein VE01_10623 [Pseudogymnoascus verrucosus]|uniref:Uncharacterized protein n=1 Tax=Pseudogymnoascus verrucosus TaxID=342668 RepID=A0A1B8G6D5_9PEZI|nr:uncharacterized protein VE01_10623 [Pseudogymnoascus verrucosus]OBT91393.1 hypothetical protein VE01_10623 [Pseudogymnoascus verrucosus]
MASTAATAVSAIFAVRTTIILTMVITKFGIVVTGLSSTCLARFFHVLGRPEDQAIGHGDQAIGHGHPHGYGARGNGHGLDGAVTRVRRLLGHRGSGGRNPYLADKWPSFQPDDGPTSSARIKTLRAGAPSAAARTSKSDDSPVSPAVTL